MNAESLTYLQLRRDAVRRERVRYVKLGRMTKWIDRAIYAAAFVVLTFPALASTKIWYDITRGNDIPVPTPISYYFTEWDDAFNELWTEVTGWFESSN